jgi:hypothetical protein
MSVIGSAGLIELQPQRLKELPLSREQTAVANE